LVFISIFNIFLNTLLVPKFGMNGAAIGTAISFSLIGLIQLIEANYYLSIIPLKTKMFRIFIIGVLSAIVLSFIKKGLVMNLFNMFILSTMFLLLYLFLIAITNCLDENDLMILESIKNKIFFRKTL
jgi:O-antigen/teichoic acid export membrane protein